MYILRFLSWTIFLCLGFGFVGQVSGSSLYEASFQELGSPWTMTPVSQGTTETSLLVCAVKVFNITNSASFTYNENNICTPGSAPYISTNATSNNGEKLYIKDRPNNEPKCPPPFSLMSNGSTTACLWLVRNSSINYDAANSFCLANESFLVSVKTVEKLNILRSFSLALDFWVGADDLVTEGNYTWKEDGTSVVSPETSAIFYEPTNLWVSNTDINCVLYDSGTFMLDISSCTVQLPEFVCEKSLV